MLTVGLVGLVGMGGVLPPGDVAVRGWPRGSLWPSGGPGAGGVGSFGTPGGCPGVVGWRCHWAVGLVSAGPRFLRLGAVARWCVVRASLGVAGCRWVPWGRRGVVVGGWLVVGCGQV